MQLSQFLFILAAFSVPAIAAPVGAVVAHQSVDSSSIAPRPEVTRSKSKRGCHQQAPQAENFASTWASSYDEQTFFGKSDIHEDLYDEEAAQGGLAQLTSSIESFISNSFGISLSSIAPSVGFLSGLNLFGFAFPTSFSVTEYVTVVGNASDDKPVIEEVQVVDPSVSR